MINNDNNIIPVDDAMKLFENHLLSHDRVILSAKFGDGKSFFLNEFKKRIKSDPNSNFEFITLYPVNYQVLENKDVFELIKHDVLLQILLLGFIDKNYTVTDEMAFAFYMQTHFCSVAETFFSMLSSIGYDEQITLPLWGCFKIVEWLKKLKEKVNDYKRKVDQTELLDNYLSKFDENTIYDNDIITKIIRDNIVAHQKKTQKKVVLVIEDMDRLDPAHLFRIMNIFSAHMDNCYHGLQSDNCALLGNKFGVSNVVFVMHEENTKAIFGHFYGENADYEGYMSKFYNKDIFKFSLKDEKEKYALRLIMQKTGLDEDKVSEIFNSGFFVEKSMRNIVFSLDKVEKQFQSLEIKEGVKPDSQLLKLFVIAKRLGVTKEHLVSTIARRFKEYDTFYIDRLLPFIAYNPNVKIIDKVYVEFEDRGNYYLLYEGIKDNGLCSHTIMNCFDSVNGGDQELMQRIYYMLSLLG